MGRVEKKGGTRSFLFTHHTAVSNSRAIKEKRKERKVQRKIPLCPVPYRGGLSWEVALQRRKKDPPPGLSSLLLSGSKGGKGGERKRYEEGKGKERGEETEKLPCKT